jgi:methylenetetrahydrofolate reductase (NADPH)
MVDFSLETTARRVGELAAVQGLLPAGTRVAIPHLDGDSPAELASAARMVRDLGFVPVPHVAARRLGSFAELSDHLSALRDTTDQVFVVGGDPVTPEGPFADALAVIRSGLLVAYGFRGVGLAGYPSGHPLIGQVSLWDGLIVKASALREQGLDGSVTTQFASPAAVADWIAEARRRGIDLPVRVGVAGPAGIPASVAARLGIAEAAPHTSFGDRPLHFSPFGALRETTALAAIG